MDEAEKESPADPSFRNSHSLTKNRISSPGQMLPFSAGSALLYPKIKKNEKLSTGRMAKHLAREGKKPAAEFAFCDRPHWAKAPNK